MSWGNPVVSGSGTNFTEIDGVRTFTDAWGSANTFILDESNCRALLGHEITSAQLAGAFRKEWTWLGSDPPPANYWQSSYQASLSAQGEQVHYTMTAPFITAPPVLSGDLYIVDGPEKKVDVSNQIITARMGAWVDGGGAVLIKLVFEVSVNIHIASYTDTPGSWATLFAECTFDDTPVVAVNPKDKVPPNHD